MTINIYYCYDYYDIPVINNLAILVMTIALKNQHHFHYIKIRVVKFQS